MPNTREIEMLRSAESAVLAALANGQPQRIAAIGESVRAATNNPLFPDAIILTAICNLSDLGKIIPATTDGFLFYSLPSSAPASTSEAIAQEPSNG
jgi:hypothetical protein